MNYMTLVGVLSVHQNAIPPVFSWVIAYLLNPTFSSINTICLFSVPSVSLCIQAYISSAKVSLILLFC